MDGQSRDTTRGKLLALLGRGPRTVNELAAELGLTDNAVRAQLERMAQAGLVRQVGRRPGIRKPHADFALTSEAGALFPKAYEPVLKHIVDVLAERLPPDQIAPLLREVAARLLREHVGEIPPAQPAARLAHLLQRLGGSAAGIHVEQTASATQIRSCGCPLASVTAKHPELCDLLATILTDVLGADVRQQCEREDSPRCRFELPPQPSTANRHEGGGR